MIDLVRERLARIWASPTSRILLLLGAVYVAIRTLTFVGVEPVRFNDTKGYVWTSEEPLISRRFLAGLRPPTLPLLYKVVTGNEARVIAQLAISIGCWLALAATVSSALADRRMKVLGFAAVLVFSLGLEIVIWDPFLLSESISISLTAALAATGLAALRSPTWTHIALMLAVAAAWTMARDLHAYVVLFLAVCVAASLMVGGHRRTRAAVAAGLAVIGVAGVVSATAEYPRWQAALQSVIAGRIAADPDKLAYFEDAGMPVTPRFLELSRFYRETGASPFLYPTDPLEPKRLMPFQDWLIEEGRGTYTRYLLTQPRFVVEAFGELDRTLLFPRVDSYASKPGPWRVPILPEVAYPRNVWLPLVYLAIAVGLAIAAAARAGPRLTWAVPALLIVVSLAFAVLAFHGDPVDLDRHTLIASLFFRLGTLLLLVMALDRLLSAGRHPDRREEPSAAGTY